MMLLLILKEAFWTTELLLVTIDDVDDGDDNDDNDEKEEEEDEDERGVCDSNGGFLSGKTWRLQKREQGHTNEDTTGPMDSYLIFGNSINSGAIVK